MDIKNKFFILCLVFIVLISISFVSASDNLTDTISTDNSDELAIDEIYGNDDHEILKDSENPAKAKIYAKDFSTFYDSDKPLSIQIKDENGNALENINVNVSSELLIKVWLTVVLLHGHACPGNTAHVDSCTLS